MKKITRNKDGYQKQVFDFINDVLVECPKCDSQAIVKCNGFSFSATYSNDIKLVCTHCGYSKSLEQRPDSLLFSAPGHQIFGKHFYIGGAVDPFFQVPLWLKTSCSGNVLWAYNYDHLTFLETYVEAKLRERNGQEHSNKSLGSRLPKWMTTKKNRVDVIQSIAELKNKR
jgi:hypothetical protein